ncbi:MAG: TauD/TfdA family dioxygenase [Acidimicrobiales bacterium]
MERAQTIAGMRAAEDCLVASLSSMLHRGALDDELVRGPSLLPGWSRAHVLTHLARNADSITRAFDGAQRGEVAARYPGPPGQRDREIEDGAKRPALALVDDVVRSIDGLTASVDAMTDTAWDGLCQVAGGQQPVAGLPWWRWREVALHQLDLDLPGFGVDDWSRDFVAAEAVHAGEPNAGPTRVAELNGRPGRDPAAWTAASLDGGWCRAFTADEIAALREGLTHYRRAMGGLALTPTSGPHFVADWLGPLVEDLRRRLIDGQGVAALEGFPVAEFGLDELRVIWWGLCSAIGTHRSQSHRGDLIGDVRDIGTGISGRVGRGYTSNSELNFHADACDVSGLFFLRTAKEGGVTRVASSVTTHDRIAGDRPDLLDELYRAMPCSWQGNQPEGEPGWYPMPVFGRVGGRVSAAYVRTNILLAAENAGAPPLTAHQVEAVEQVRSVASEPDLWVERRFDPGAMLFVHNHTILHLRTAFVDWDEPDRRRHLLRSWLSLPNNRELPASFATFFGATAAGSLRGGYQSRSGRYTFATN